MGRGPVLGPTTEGGGVVKLKSNCIEWTGARTSAGYGVVRVDGKPTYAHRIEWEKHRGTIPAKHVARRYGVSPSLISLINSNKHRTRP